MSKALIVDDNAINRKLLNRILVKLGWEFDEVENGQLAIDAYVSERYDLILMDIQMPVLDGIEATHGIRAFETTQKISPCHIIALTAHGYPGYEEVCLSHGMDAYLDKPFTFVQLKEKMDAVLVK